MGGDLTDDFDNEKVSTVAIDLSDVSNNNEFSAIGEDLADVLEDFTVFCFDFIFLVFKLYVVDV